MTPQEYFGDWFKYIDVKSMNVALSYITKEGAYYPKASDVFRAFTLCNVIDTSVVFLGQDPYPQKDRATGILFGNPPDIPELDLSSSLRVIKDSIIDYEIPHNIVSFDNTLESWAKQGILMLNSSLTVKPDTPMSHSLYWRPFIAHFLQSFSSCNGGMLYVLFGKQAQSFKQYISKSTSTVIEVEHPAYIARNKKKFPKEVFDKVKDHMLKTVGYNIKWFNEENYGELTL